MAEPDSEATPSSAAGSFGRFVGRQMELTSLMDALGRLSMGQAQFVGVSGEPGIGKTRILAELAREATSRGQLVLTSRAAEFDSDAPMGVLVGAIDDHIGGLDLERLERLNPGCIDLLREIFPALASRVARRRAALAAERYRLHRAVRALLEEMATPRGMVLILDDLHWADGASVELLCHLLRHPPQAPMVVALSYRSQQMAARLILALADATREGLAHHVELGPLSIEEAGELLGPGVSRSSRQRLYQASQGNPLYLEALASLGGSFRRPLGPIDTGVGDVPPAVRAALSAEVDALSPAGRLVAQAAAVAGDPFDLPLVAKVAGVEDADVLVAIDELLARDLVRETGSFREFCYRHPLVRHVVYTATGAGWRLAAHARAAATLAARGASVIARASHVERAALPGDEQAISLLIEAAYATMPQAPATTAHWLKAALGLLPPSEQASQRRLDLLVGLATSLGAAGHLSESRDTLHEVLKLMPADQIERRVEAAAVCAMTERLLGRHADARQLLLGELTALVESDRPEVAVLKLELAVGLLCGDLDDANHPYVRRELAVAKVSGDPLLRASALAADALASCSVGAVDTAIASAREAAHLVDSLCDEEFSRRLDVFVWLGWSEIFLERYDRALRHLSRGLAIARFCGQHPALPRLLAGMSALYGLLGRLSEAASCVDDALDAAVLSGSEELLRVALTMQCQNAILAGDVAAALQAGRQATTETGSTRGRWWGLAWVALAEAYLAAGDPLSCVSAIMFTGGGVGLSAILYPTRPRVCELLTRAELALGNVERATAWAEHADATRAALGLTGAGGFALLAHAQVLLTRNPNEAAERALAAASAFQRVGNRMDAGRAQLLAGIALSADGKPAGAAAELRGAETLFAACGARRLHEQARHEQRRLNRPRNPSPTSAPPGLLTLTPRELEIADLVSKGQTNQQIARKLSVSHKTVEAHLSRVFSKLGTSSRAAVASTVAQARVWDEIADFSA